tara:strand:+ start:1209 stop:2000 length:792 start_codon:yes stop_codon:yes gene_type:complete
MDVLKVVDLLERLNSDFPVAGNDGPSLIDHAELSSLEHGHLLRKGMEPIEQGFRIWIPIDENPAVPGLTAQFANTALLIRNSRFISDKATGSEIVKVALLRTAKNPIRKLPARELLLILKIVASRIELLPMKEVTVIGNIQKGGTVNTGIEEGMHSAILPTDKNHLDPKVVPDLVKARLRELLLTSRIEPSPRPEMLHLQVIELVTPVPTCRNIGKLRKSFRGSFSSKLVSNFLLQALNKCFLHREPPGSVLAVSVLSCDSTR